MTVRVRPGTQRDIAERQCPFFVSSATANIKRKRGIAERQCPFFVSSATANIKKNRDIAERQCPFFREQCE